MRDHSPETLCYASKEECILVFLATGEKTALGKDIQEAYETWENMALPCRWEMDRHMLKSLKTVAQRELYEALVRGFQIWDHTQDVDGAPGWNIKDSSINDVMKHIGGEMLGLLRAMEEIWMECTKAASEKPKPPELRPANSEVRIRGTDGEGIMGTSVGIEDAAIRGGVDGRELPLCLPSLSKEEKVEEFRKAHFEKEFDDAASRGECPMDTSDPGAEHHEEPVSPDASKSKDRMDFSIDEDSHLRNLRLSDCHDDSDVEKQISPLISDNEE